jgi:hypothetical protein
LLFLFTLEKGNGHEFFFIFCYLFFIFEGEKGHGFFFHFLLLFCKVKSYMDVPNLISFFNLGFWGDLPPIFKRFGLS